MYIRIAYLPEEGLKLVCVTTCLIPYVDCFDIDMVYQALLL